MEAYGVAPQYWVTLLTPLLDSKCTRVVVQLPALDIHDYSKVKAILLKRFNIDEQAFRIRWQTLEVRQGESYREMGSRGLLFLESWCKEATTKQEILDTFAIELSSLLPPHLQTWIRDKKQRLPMNCWTWLMIIHAISGLIKTSRITKLLNGREMTDTTGVSHSVHGTSQTSSHSGSSRSHPLSPSLSRLPKQLSTTPQTLSSRRPNSDFGW